MNFTDYKLYNKLYEDVAAARKDLTTVYEGQMLRHGHAKDIANHAHITNMQKAYSYYLEHKGQSPYFDINVVGKIYIKSIAKLQVVEDMVENININISNLGNSVIKTQVDKGKGSLHTYVEVELSWFHNPAHKAIVKQINKNTKNNLEVV